MLEALIQLSIWVLDAKLRVESSVSVVLCALSVDLCTLFALYAYHQIADPILTPLQDDPLLFRMVKAGKPQ